MKQLFPLAFFIDGQSPQHSHHAVKCPSCNQYFRVKFDNHSPLFDGRYNFPCRHFVDFALHHQNNSKHNWYGIFEEVA